MSKYLEKLIQMQSRVSGKKSPQDETKKEKEERGKITKTRGMVPFFERRQRTN
jgi:hypothetical protein